MAVEGSAIKASCTFPAYSGDSRRLVYTMTHTITWTPTKLFNTSNESSIKSWYDHMSETAYWGKRGFWHSINVLDLYGFIKNLYNEAKLSNAHNRPNATQTYYVGPRAAMTLNVHDLNYSLKTNPLDLSSLKLYCMYIGEDHDLHVTQIVANTPTAITCLQTADSQDRCNFFVTNQDDVILCTATAYNVSPLNMADITVTSVEGSSSYDQHYGFISQLTWNNYAYMQSSSNLTVDKAFTKSEVLGNIQQNPTGYGIGNFGYETAYYALGSYGMNKAGSFSMDFSWGSV